MVFVYNSCYILLIFFYQNEYERLFQFIVCRFSKHFLCDFVYHVFCFYFFANWLMNTTYTAYSQCLWLGHTGDRSFPSVSADMTVIILRMNNLFWWLPEFLEKFFFSFFVMKMRHSLFVVTVAILLPVRPSPPLLFDCQSYVKTLQESQIHSSEVKTMMFAEILGNL